MARETFEHTSFGVTYRTKQFSAAYGFRVMGSGLAAIRPTEMLSLTEVRAENGEWVRLDNEAAIDAYVRCLAGSLAPRIVLAGVMKVVNKFNWGFLDEWKVVKIPSRFRSDAQQVSRDNVDPFVSRIVADHYATHRELEEYYSLEDAFKMYDEICVNTVNKLLQQEQAEIDAKSKRGK
ncbi:hypothetical protein [Caballeronia sp. LZ035]|uniref:hypothetical protein n=1 Tax=Caballeronia sp. LZ035 TaxID=3038568 RepID=UPI00285FDB37|nr:hypothetical protein [Caballeronia sp. LZ035]MDR5757646.1 hypothetical protein [Caballeronia sp. LZ035]